MAIQQISWPQANINSTMDFSPLAKLGDIYRKAQADDRRQTALQSLGADPTTDAQTLLRSGDVDLAQLGIGMRNRTVDQQRQDARYAVTDPQAAERLGFERDANVRAGTRLGYEGNADTRAANADVRAGNQDKRAQETADRANRTVAEIFKERHDAWVGQGWKPEGAEYKEAIINGSISDARAAASANKAGLSPFYGTRKNEKGEDVTVMMQPSGTGEAVETKLPPGVTVSNKPIMVDAGTYMSAVDPITRQEIARYPKDLAGKAAQEAIGEGRGKSIVALPTIEANATEVLGMVDKVLKHPGKTDALGAWSYLPAIRGTNRADFEALQEQLKGQAFLSAYDTLRGAGQISEGEGKAATAALIRAQSAQSVSGFNDAMGDFRKHVERFTEVAREKARGGQATAPAAAEAGGPTTADIVKRARAAIARGAPRDEVRKRLMDNFIDPKVLD